MARKGEKVMVARKDEKGYDRKGYGCGKRQKTLWLREKTMVAKKG